MEPQQKASLLHWRGIMADSPKEVRFVSEALLALLACTMVATQTNYFVIGNTHLIAALAPIAACGLLYGTISATVIGAITGAAELIHAIFLPLDAYEAYFAAPTNSVVLFAFMGFLMGILYALSNRRTYKNDMQGLLALVIACAIGSVAFTLLFSVSVNAINMLVSRQIPTGVLDDFTSVSCIAAQIFANFLLMAVLSVVAGIANRSRLERDGQRTLRETFQGWLAVVIAAAYLVTAALGYTAISAACRQDAERQIQGQLDYLYGQLQERDLLIGGLAAFSPWAAAEADGLHSATISRVATGLPLGESGICAVAEDGIIVSANEESLLGASFEEVVGSGLVSGFDESLYSQTRSSQWYMDGGEMAFVRIAQMGYVRVARTGSYQMLAALPASEVFAPRPMLMAVASAVFLGLFAVMYLQASLLLKNVVVRNIDETNEALSRITQGELDQKVTIEEPVEFARLSSGINATVGSLKDAIAAESARIERDLSTAKAIQESALPSTFPPFPHISAFDIYANMTAAREVGGDFYDFFEIDDHTLGFLIADVSGKGIPAALFMMAAKTELSNYMASGMDLAEAVQTANWHLCQGNDAGMFVTVWAAKLDWNTGYLTYVNAGHNPPLLRHGGTWQWLRTKGGLFLGAFDTAIFKSASIKLEPGDQLLLYTDGVNEAFNASEEQYGDDRLEKFLADHSELHPHALVDSLKHELQVWAEGVDQSDDITMLSIEYGVPPEVSGSITVPATADHLDDVLSFIHGELGRRFCPIAIQNKLDVVIEELYINVCNYAYEQSGGKGECRVEYAYNANPNTIAISIIDWGTPFDPLERDDPDKPASIAEAKIGGLGIFMAKRIADDIAYMRDGDANVTTFTKGW